MPKRWVLTGAAAYCCCIVAIFGLLDGPWIAGWALLAMGAAVYGPTRYAILPAASHDSRVPLTRVNGWIEMGSVTAIIAGLALGVHLEDTDWLNLPGAVTAAIGLNLLAIVTALPTHFPSDIRRPDQAGEAIAGFFRDTAESGGTAKPVRRCSLSEACGPSSREEPEPLLRSCSSMNRRRCTPRSTQASRYCFGSCWERPAVPCWPGRSDSHSERWV